MVATCSPSQSIVPMFSSSPTYITMPQISKHRRPRDLVDGTTRITNRSPGKPAKISSSETPIAVPTANAATIPSTPMLIPVVVATRKTAISTIIEISSLDIRRPPQ